MLLAVLSSNLHIPTLILPSLFSPRLFFCVIVAKTQFLRYLGLWIVSSNRPPEESQDGVYDYSILAVAGAMYLLLSIAAADLWSGSALALEERGSLSHGWFWWRKLFGLALLATFFSLIGASISVLFYSSYEDVELVIGAAAVLFIADVVSETSLAQRPSEYFGSTREHMHA